MSEVLLLGGSALALAPRLSASGYSTVDLKHLAFAYWDGLEDQWPLAAVLSADQRNRIARLREKLEAGGEGRLLHTFRGRGYCLGPLAFEG